MSGFKVIIVIVAGIASGLFLGLFLKVVEHITTLKVYTLLLNIDYIPVLKDMDFTEAGEFGLHLIISIVLSIIIQFYLMRKDWSSAGKVKFVLGVSLVVGLLLYPTTLLSDRTPSITSASSFLFWMLAHGLYGVVLGIMLTLKFRRKT